MPGMSVPFYTPDDLDQWDPDRSLGVPGDSIDTERFHVV